jgi:hypothetical protein
MLNDTGATFYLAQRALLGRNGCVLGKVGGGRGGGGGVGGGVDSI